MQDRASQHKCDTADGKIDPDFNIAHQNGSRSVAHSSNARGGL